MAVVKVNKKFLETLSMENLLKAIEQVNAIEDLPETVRVITDPDPGKEMLADAFRKAVNKIPGSDEEVATKLGETSMEIYMGLIKKDQVIEAPTGTAQATGSAKKKNKELVKEWVASGKTEEEIFALLQAAYPDRDDVWVRTQMKKYLKPAPVAKRNYEDCSKSKIFLAWEGGEKDPVKLHTFIKEAVKLTTIRKWVSGWNSGKRWPSIYKQRQTA